VARANGIKVENTSVRKALPDVHMGMSTFNDHSPNSPYVGMIQPNVVYISRAAGYNYDMANSGPSNSSSVKAPSGSGPRYTV